MKTNTISKLLAAVAACSLALASNVSAISISVGDSYYLGSIEPGSPSGASDQLFYINTLRTNAPGGIVVIAKPPAGSAGDQTITRSGNAFGALPEAVALGSIGDSTSPPLTFDLGAGWNYILAKYGNDSYVWYINGLLGDLTLPTSPNGNGLSHWSLYNPGRTTVPDGGSMLVLLGGAVAVLGFLRRKISA